jgi:hypothetical protein
VNVSVIRLSLLHEMQSEDTQVKISGVGGRQPIVKLTGYGIPRRFFMYLLLNTLLSIF